MGESCIHPQKIFMNALFPIGEVPHFPSIQPAATQFSDGMELSDGVREAAKNGAQIRPAHAHSGSARRTWSLPWALKLSSTKLGGRPE
jgi:hypothetical protein